MMRLEAKKSQSPLRSKVGEVDENIGLVTCVRFPPFTSCSITTWLFASLSSCESE